MFWSYINTYLIKLYLQCLQKHIVAYLTEQHVIIVIIAFAYLNSVFSAISITKIQKTKHSIQKKTKQHTKKKTAPHTKNKTAPQTHSRNAPSPSRFLKILQNCSCAVLSNRRRYRENNLNETQQQLLKISYLKKLCPSGVL